MQDSYRIVFLLQLTIKRLGLYDEISFSIREIRYFSIRKLILKIVRILENY